MHGVSTVMVDTPCLIFMNSGDFGMCGIFAIIRQNPTKHLAEVNAVIKQNSMRGDDGWGVLVKGRTTRIQNVIKNKEDNLNYQSVIDTVSRYDAFMGTFRAAPLPELPSDNATNVQPFCVGGRVYIVHNGTLSNDEELASKYGLTQSNIDSELIARLYLMNMQATNNDLIKAVQRTCAVMQGGFAIILYDTFINRYVVIKNYKTLNIHYVPHELISLSSEVPKDHEYFYTQLEPYNAYIINPNSIIIEQKIPLAFDYATKYIPDADPKHILVVCSGGMDSSLSVAIAKHYLCADKIDVLNFNYGQRGYKGEAYAAQKVAEEYGGNYIHLDLRNFFSKEAQTPLTDYSKDITLGVKGTEASYEWVPARNLQMLSIGAGIAESVGASKIIFGGNLEEECVAYNDNDYSFIRLLSETMHHGTLKGITIMPVLSHMMKSDIATLGMALDVPLHLTLSCYDPIEVNTALKYKDPEKYALAKKYKMPYIPCGVCGCCAQRANAFHSAHIEDPQKDLYFGKIPQFKSWDYHQTSIDKNGFYDTLDKDWRKRVIEKYAERITN